MPGSTTRRGYPYPLGPDPIDIAGDIKKLADAVDTDHNGLVSRQIKASQEGGFGNGVEYGISGLAFVVPATPTGRMHKVHIGFDMTVTQVGGSASLLFAYLRQGSVTGAIAGKLSWPFPPITTYSLVMTGWIMSTGLLVGQQYIVTTLSDGAGRYNMHAGSWSELHDVS